MKLKLLQSSMSLALKSIMANKMRSFLTMLGIIIGVAAVIILVGLVGGFANSITDSFSSLGSNNINAMIFRSGSVDVDDIEKFVLENPQYFTAYTPTASLNATVKNGADSLSSTASGVNEMDETIDALKVGEGRFLCYMDCKERRRVCVLGTYIASELGISLGDTIRINSFLFEVVGILTETDGGAAGSGDDCLYLPYTTVSRIDRSEINSYKLMVGDVALVNQATEALEAYLTKETGSEDYFRVMSAQAMVDMVNELTGTLSMVLVGIAGISLLVGGIGIMNIMIVSVTERTREIGIRKSIGAKQRDILSQFLIEAAVTSALGGVIGIVVGVTLSVPLAGLMGLSASVSMAAVIIAFSVSAGIGVIFGYFPAVRAAKLNPIDALRYD